MRTSQWGLFCSLIFFCLTPAYALELGDGSDGNCVWSNGDTIEVRLWQCITFDISGTITFVDNTNDQTGVDVLDIRVQQNATVDGVMDLSAPGPNGGFGGYLGGNGVSGADGQNGQGPSTSHGQGGTASLSGGFSECSGAGGSGGRHSGLNSPAAGDDTDLIGGGGCSPDPAPGGAAPTENSSDPTSLRGEIRGGPGGGAGGGADDTFTTVAGGNGGAGGGVIRILTGETLDLGANADLNVNGANGGNGTNLAANAQSGGGGGGAGGIIYLASLTDINITTGANLQASGGTAGTSTSPGGNGTAGDSGIIRLEDDDGIINGADGASTPSASKAPVEPLVTDSQTVLSSDISPGCALRHSNQKLEHLGLILFIGLALAMVLGQGLLRTMKVDRTSF